MSDTGERGRLASGWQQLDPSPRRQRVLFGGGAVGLAAILGMQVANSVQLLEMPFPWSVLLLVGVSAAIPAATILVHLLLRPTPFVDPGRGLLKIGRRVLRYEELGSARYGVAGWMRASGVVLELGDGARRASVLLQLGGRRILSGRQSELLIDLIERSAIEVPTSSYDPQQRFTSVNFPGALDKDAAIRFVQDPPPADGPFPSPDRPRKG